jgi:hypothetical protein
MRTVFSAVLAAGLLAGAGHAMAASKATDSLGSFETADAIKGQDYLNVAMTADMDDLLRRAQVTSPDVMLEYGLALELGRPSASAALGKDDKEKLKRGYRAMLDLYLGSGDKFGKVKFDEDSMLDVPDFWIALAEHIGRPKERVDMQAAADATAASMTQAGGGSALSVIYVPDQSLQDQEFNLGNDLILNRHVVNAVWSCAQSAESFARLRKVQMLDISQTKLTPTQFGNAMAAVVADYRVAYQEGVLACGSRDYFFKVAEVAGRNLGKLGELKEAPNAQPAPLNTPQPVMDGAK